jgi:hypothetical protein
MSRTKKPSKLSADERAFLNRMRSLNEEETEKLTWEEIIADLNIMHKIDPGDLSGGRPNRRNFGHPLELRIAKQCRGKKDNPATR